MSTVLRAAGPDDAALIAAFVQELAEFEKLSHEAVATAADFAAALSGPVPRVFAEIAEFDGEAAGFTLWFHTFSTFTGRPGIYLEDLYVRPAFRRRGIARALLGRLAQRCVAEELGRLEWAVLKWNAPAIAFYESLGAMAMDGWTVYRTDGQALKRLGSQVERAGDEDEGR
ncbi:MAG: GNAT family N-acetyltransferase [Ancylobacter novellus]|uniref:GNAT family N-acetyltransferase n=1 Tax=Ancylobacter novellus TaxID=921 RepID=A0A2W5MTE2_ANCNO|nr:MAG: GNAT family N-acetyltransferase [Ancylobacter novellus]